MRDFSLLRFSKHWCFLCIANFGCGYDQATSHLLAIFIQAALGEEEEEVPKLPPMFITEFVLDTAQLTFLPDEEEFQDKIAEVIKQFQVGR